MSTYLAAWAILPDTYGNITDSSNVRMNSFVYVNNHRR